MDPTEAQASAGAGFYSLIAEKADAFEVVGLRGSADALLIAERFRAHQETALVLVDDEKRAEAIASNLASFLGQAAPNRQRTGDLAQSGTVLTFPAYGGVPFDGTSPNGEVVVRRLAALYRLLDTGRPCIVVASLEAALGRLAPRAVIESASLPIETDKDLALDTLASRLIEWGYMRTGMVEDAGNFSLRGGILDIFCPMYPRPVRIDLFGDTVQSMRFFDPGSQRSGDPVTRYEVRPVREIIMDATSRQRGVAAVREIGGRSAASRDRLFSALDQLDSGMAFSGMEDWLVHFHGGHSTLLDYLPPEARVAVIDAAHMDEAATEILESAAEHHQQAIVDGQMVVALGDRYLEKSELDSLLEVCKRMHLNTMGAAAEQALPVRHTVTCREIDATWNARRSGGSEGAALEAAATALRQWMDEGWRVLLTAHTTIQLDRLGHLLTLREIPWTRHERMPHWSERSGGRGSIHLVLSEISKGFQLDAEALILLSEDEIFGRKTRARAEMPASAHPTRRIETFSELNKDDLIVHVDHGVGRYKGLKRMTVAGIENDFLELEYKGNDKIFLPIFKLKKVQKYACADSDVSPPLDQLGGKGWESRKAKAMEAIERFAKELLDLYAQRQSRPGVRFGRQDGKEEAFAAAFAFTETPDQKNAIEAVLDDMEQARPMDRLICGDVGFGKTEIAMRAAFKAAVNGYQTAVLVPTTVLAMQHFHTFTKRFAGTPYKVDYISRFRSASEAKQILEAAKLGKVDILVGTHRLLSKDVKFDRLGLLVIDEEQRFGVTHKEKIKQWRTEVDVIAMSATPIPRTLNLSLSGIRDISTIQTPPADRLAVRTFLMPYNDHTVREAVLREIQRGGQVFLLHNKIQTIFQVAQRLEKLIPEARIAVGHAQMHQNHLEEVMMAFYRGDFNVLVCTTIIESGLDIPNANTIIIDSPHTLGLSQLYQLRGRVGRSNRRAFCYLLLPEGLSQRRLPPDAQKRLDAIMESTGLGSSFQIAYRDMEIRGAGEFLGIQQSGQLSSIGYDLYMQLLEEKIRDLKGEATVDEVEPEVQIPLSAFLPDDYIADEKDRIRFYRRISDAPSTELLEELGAELEDRFGPPPQGALNLIEMARLRIRLKQLGVLSLVLRDQSWYLRIGERSVISPDRLIQLAMQKKGRLLPDGTAILPASKAAASPVAMAQQFLESLLPKAA